MPDGNRDAHDAWDANARFWDARMGDGNDFFTVLVWPAVERLLAVGPGERVLDVACGNGLTSRRLAAAGAQVIGCDVSETMIELARRRGGAGQLDYRVLDATDAAALRALAPPASFDAGLCNMALMDMADVEPLLRAIATLLGPAGRFVVSLIHPCFNNPSTVQTGELEDRDGELVATYAVKVSRYVTPYTRRGVAIPGQPVPHPYFHRSLSDLLRPAFAAGLVVDALEEPAFPPENATGAMPLSWKRFSEIPPALVVRLRPGAVRSGDETTPSR